jgi:hypothetical protein
MSGGCVRVDISSTDRMCRWRDGDEERDGGGMEMKNETMSGYDVYISVSRFGNVCIAGSGVVCVMAKTRGRVSWGAA